MFYAQFVLSKKGPLAKIWLAAHWEKKLSKAQVYETNVADAVEEIMKPKVKIALRTTGHLLLGIVRIYSKRVGFLLDDCNSAFLKVNTSIRSTRSEDRRVGNAPELVMSDFDVADLAEDLELPSAPVHLHQSRIDDITLREDNVGAQDRAGSYFADIGCGLDDFGEGDAPIDLMTDEYYANKGREIGSSLGRSTPFEGARRDDGRDSQINSVGEVDPSIASVGDADFGDIDDFCGIERHVNGGDFIDNSLKLDSLEVDVPVSKAPKRKRKRLLVDDAKNITGDEMKANMADFQDIMQPLDLAPPTKKLMHLRETGGVDKLFSMPGCRPLCDTTVMRIYQSHLVPHAKPSEETENSIRNDLEMVDNVIDEPDFYPGDDDFGNFDGLDAPDSNLPGGQFDPIEEVDENLQPDLASPVRDGEKRSRRQRQERDREESGDEDDVEQRCSRRTHAVANAINSRLKSNESITLNDLLTKGSTHRTAAQKFYALLELAKKQAIKVHQDEPFGEITVTEGPQMATVLAG